MVNNFMALYRGYNTVDNNTTKTRLEDVDLIRRDLINHFNIRKGEKLMRPEFGTVVWDLLFEPLTEDVQQAITDDVKQVINYDPRITVEKMLVDSYDNGILIELNIRIKNSNQTDVLNLKFDQNLTFTVS